MAEELTQRELRNRSGEIMRALDRGQSFTVTRNGVPVGELTPRRRPHFVSAEHVRAEFDHLPHVDARSFRRDLDAFVDLDPAPRG